MVSLDKGRVVNSCRGLWINWRLPLCDPKEVSSRESSASHFAVFASAVVVFLELYYSALSAEAPSRPIDICSRYGESRPRAFPCSRKTVGRTLLLSICTFPLRIVYSVAENSRNYLDTGESTKFEISSNFESADRERDNDCRWWIFL